MPASRSARAVGVLCLVAGPIGATLLHWFGLLGALRLPATALSLPGAILMLLVAPVLEELAFRGTLQDWCRSIVERHGMRDAGPLTRANAATSVAFAACHSPYQPAALACAILLPSLLLGRLREVTGSVVPCILLHAWFNACFLAVVMR
jgi:membrane protease YdiL (CAAX protease family)